MTTLRHQWEDEPAPGKACCSVCGVKRWSRRQRNGVDAWTFSALYLVPGQGWVPERPECFPSRTGRQPSLLDALEDDKPQED